MNKLSAYKAYLFMVTASALLFATAYALATIYYVQSVGLNPLQLVLVGTVLETTYFLFEVPTGVVADTYSRRLSVLIGIVVIGACIFFEGLIPAFAAVLLAEAVRGVGETFISGAQDAWIADEVGEEQVGRVYLRGAQMSQIGSFVGIFVATALASLRLNLPMVVGGALMMVLGLCLALVMPETGFRPTPRGERTTWQAMASTFREGVRVVRSRPRLVSILGIGLIFGAFSEGFDRLSEVHYLRNLSFPALGDLKPVVWFGIINAGGMVLSLAVAEVARRRINTNSHTSVARALLGINALLSLSVIAFALAGSFAFALGAYWLATVLRATQDPLYTTWLNQNVGSRVRATVLSMGGQANALGQIAGGPSIGAISTVFSLRAALAASGALLLPALLLYRLALHGHEEPEAAVAEPADGA